jgi:hypothetical protein
MAAQRNLLLGNGHRLTKPVVIQKGMDLPPPPYGFEEAKNRVVPQLQKAAASFDSLNDDACPGDFAVGVLTLHPQYTAKSFYPGTLLRETRLTPLGSRPSRITPEKVRNEKQPVEAETVQLYVAAKRSEFRNVVSQLQSWTAGHPGANELFEIETFHALTSKERIQPIRKRETKSVPLETVVHIGGELDSGFILDAYAEYTSRLGIQPDFGRRFELGGLCFVPVMAPRDRIARLADFSFLRAVREMPELRPLRPAAEMRASSKPFPVTFPSGGPIDPQLECAVFDGGIPAGGPLSAFAVAYDPPGIGTAVPEYVAHGVGVTSAALFGPLVEGEPLERPYGIVHHHRVLDADPTEDPFELYNALDRIRNTLQSRKYPFVNLSVGPALPIEDHEVHAWTAVIDSLLSDGETLLTVAAGNTGHLNPDTGFHRVQVPSDCVNAMTIGAANSMSVNWARAAYSSVGPGRSPGLVKPDVVTFGGDRSEPFFVLNSTASAAVPQAGTSFSSPNAVRTAMGIRAHFGKSLSALTIKTLMVHCANDNGLPRHEVGWGRAESDVGEIVTCGEGCARIVYQGELTPAQYLRTPIPLPAATMAGFVTIKATFGIASETDAEDPSNYTRSGLDISFRPDSSKFGKEGGPHPKPTSFFRQSEYDPESELRRNAHKWETMLHHSQRFRGSSLKDSVFDVHYQIRQRGRAVQRTERIRYSLVITVEAPRVPDLYDQIVARYRTQLEAIRPAIAIPVRT